MTKFLIAASTSIGFATLALALTARSAYAAFPLADLSPFLVVYTDPRAQICSPDVAARIEADQAEIAIVGGAAEPPSRVSACDGKMHRTIHRLVDVSRDNFGVSSGTAENATRVIYGAQRWFEPCGGTRALLRSSATPDPEQGLYEGGREAWQGDPPSPSEPVSFGGQRCNTNTFGGYPPPKFMILSEYLPSAPLRRKALDGSEYDAVAIAVRREGVAWYTHHWAYRMGLVASESNFANRDQSKLPSGWLLFPDSRHDFELARLPAPRVEALVVEYVNRINFPAQPQGQYFYAVRDADKAILDSIPAWNRTGKAFKSGGYVSVCRYYGGLNGGPKTHFYSADSGECAQLRSVPQLTYEGQTFAANMPMPARTPAEAMPGALRACPEASRPLFRLYNNASQSAGRFVSNHRYTTDPDDVRDFVARGWKDEGHVMCVPN